MAIFVSREKVKNNVERFQESSQLNSAGKRSYHAMLNFKTGELQFSGKVSGADWGEVELNASESFEVPQPIEDRLLPAALNILKETIQALAEIEKLPRKEIPLEIHVMPGWKGRVSRIEAEEILDGASKGTYLLHKGDEVTEVMGQKFLQGNGVKGEVYVCTFVEAENKITDLLIFKTDKGWVFHKDDPELKNYKPLKTLEILLKSDPRLLHPLVN